MGSVLDFGSAPNDGTGDKVHEAATKLDRGARYFTVADKDLTAPPGSPAISDAYIIATGGSGAWATHDGKIAIYGLSATWLFIAPAAGMRAYVADENVVYEHNGSTWAVAPVGTIPDGSIANSKLADMAAATLKGRALGAGTGVPTDLTVAQVVDILGSTDGTLAANSDDIFATQKAVKTYVDNLLAVSDAMTLEGIIDCSANPNYPAADMGHVWIVSVAGKIGGASGPNVEVGDRLLCIADGSAAGTQAAVGANWVIGQANIDGAVINTRQVISGAGLTGGGDLSADRTLAVGAGTGITVNADDVALDTSHDRNTSHSGVTLTAGAGLTGGGDISASRTFAVGAGTGILANADDVSIDKASDANVRASAPNKVLTTDLVESASAFVALTDGANIALDWDTGVNFSLTIGGNRTLDNPTNGQPGTWRTIVITQDGTGTRTLAFGNQYKFPGGTEPVLTTAAASVDVLNILCVASTNFHVFSALDMKL